MIIKGEERQNSSLRFRDGATVTLTEATIGYDDRTVSENATEYGDWPTGFGWSGTRHRFALTSAWSRISPCGRSGHGTAGPSRARSRRRDITRSRVRPHSTSSPAADNAGTSTPPRLVAVSSTTAT